MKFLLLSAGLFFCAAGLFAQDAIDRAELQSNLGPVEFIDNTGTPTQVNTREEIFAIGIGLGNAASQGVGEYGNRGRYFVIVRRHPPEFDKLDADIFGLGANAGVDQIRNLRTIIQGYLEGAYHYRAADAALLAEYITIYNAVYRKNRGYFASRYKTPVLADVPVGLEGISVRYNEWPGQTMMMIPMQTAEDGSLSAVDTSSITERPIIDELRKDDDKGVEQRQQMVDLKEREAEEAAKRAEEQKARADAEEKRIAQERQQVADERAKIEEERKQGVSPEREQDLAAQEKALDKQDDNLDKREDAVSGDREQAAKNEALAQRKTEEADREREAISDDQRSIIAATNPPASNAKEATGVLGIKLTSRSSSVGSPVQVNPSTADIVRTSSLSAVRARSLTMVGGKVIAIAGEGGEKSVCRLIEIDPATLISGKRGEDEINPESLIWVNGSNLYALILSGGNSYIGRFGADLNRLAQSSQPVHPFASLIFQGDRILTQDGSGAVISLNASSLQ
jgi:hypothetical protein